METIKESIRAVDNHFTGLWKTLLDKRDVFLHGDFSYWGFFKNNVHLFLVLGIFGALTGYLNTFIEREVPYNAYAGKLGINQTPLSFLQATLTGHNPLNTPFPPADLIFGITTALIMFILIALAILWAAINYSEGEVKVERSSEFSLLMRISFVTLFGSLLLVFFSYVIRNYGLLIRALLEILSAFAAIYVISAVLKRTRHTWRWFFGFIVLGLIVYGFKIYLPVITTFLLVLGSISLAIAILLVPFVLIKKTIGHIRERHVDRLPESGDKIKK